MNLNIVALLQFQHGKRKGAVKQIETGKSDEEKKPENDNNIMKHTNIKLRSITEHREKGQVKPNVVTENSLMTSYTESMRPG